jgi:hypothetical protein
MTDVAIESAKLARYELWVTVGVLSTLALTLCFLVIRLVKLMEKDIPSFESHWGGLGGGLGGWSANGSLTLCFFVILVLLAFVGVSWQINSTKDEKPKEAPKSAETVPPGVNAGTSKPQPSASVTTQTSPGSGAREPAVSAAPSGAQGTSGKK